MALSDDQKAMLRLLAQREQGYDDIASLTGGSVADVRAKVKDAVAALDSGLSQDQTAMLRLLAQREEGYEDIASLTGGSVDDVRAKVRDALAALDGGTPPEQAAKEPRAPAVEPDPTPPPAREAAEPDAGPAREKPAPPRPAAKPSPKPANSPKPAPRIGLPEDRGALRALIAGAAVVVIIVLLLVTGVLGDDGESGSPDSTTASGESTLAEGGEGTPTVNGKEPTQAILEAVDGSDATGQALFGRTDDKVVLLLAAKNLQPAPEGQSYTVSLVRSESQRLPLIATSATKSGVISGRFQVAPQVLGLLAGGFDTMEISVVPDDELRVALREARRSQKAPDYGGTRVLEGPVTGPIVEAGEKAADEGG